MAKLLVQSRGSASDPAYSDQMIKFSSDMSEPWAENAVEARFADFFHREGIGTLEADLIDSAHGCSDLSLRLARNMQNLANEGHRIVVLEAGSLLWVKPGFHAANMPTVPVISVPLTDEWYGGIAAFLAPHVPTGVACVAGVGIGDYSTAARVAKNILLNEFKGVYVQNPSDSLRASLDKFGVPLLGIIEREQEFKLEDKLVVGCLDYLNNKKLLLTNNAAVSIFTPPRSHFPEDIRYFMDIMNSTNVTNPVWVRGDENVAIYAAKVMAAYNRNAFDALKKFAEDKRASYQDRKITLDSFAGVKE